MTKTNAKNVVTLTLLLIVIFAPASIAFAQTASVNATTDITDPDDKKRKDKIRDQIIDQIKKRVVKDAIPKSDVNRTADLTFKGQTDGWAIMGGTAFKSSIALSGDAYSPGGGNWKIKSVGDITVADKTAKLDLSGFAKGNTINLHGTGTLSNGEVIRIHLIGHFAPTSDTSVYAIAFTNAGIQYLDDGVRVPLMQVGSVTVTLTTPTPVPVPVTPAQ